MPAIPPPAALVLDTNVVLDWLVFRDPSTRRLSEQLARGRACWVATAAMREELEHVLTREQIARWKPDLRAIASAWADFARLMDASPPPVAPALRCTDPDDQKFVDLALQVGADALLSRDRAVLKLAARARPLGLAITTVERWTRLQG